MPAAIWLVAAAGAGSAATFGLTRGARRLVWFVLALVLLFVVLKWVGVL